MAKAKPTSNENFLKKIVRSVVKEELAPVEERLSNSYLTLHAEFNLLTKRLLEEMTKMRHEMTKMKDEILTSNDEIAGEIKNMREEYDILKGRHEQILQLEKSVEDLQKIHPKGQHAAV